MTLKHKNALSIEEFAHYIWVFFFYAVLILYQKSQKPYALTSVIFKFSFWLQKIPNTKPNAALKHWWLLQRRKDCQKQGDFNKLILELQNHVKIDFASPCEVFWEVQKAFFSF